jgi:glycosyltransferase involved in cell wall biosynthesis
MLRLAILITHPIQYYTPLYRRLAQEPNLELTVYFCSRQGSEEYVDAGFGKRLKWDRPLLEGYKYKFLKNLRRGDAVNGFLSLVNPGIVSELRTNHFDGLLISGHNHVTYVLAMAAAKFLNVPVLMRCDTHLGLKKAPLKRVLRKPLMSFLYQRVCAACLPIGTRNKEFYLAHGVNEERLFTAPFTVDNDFFIQAADQFRARSETIKAELNLPLDKPLILFASKVIPQKRPMDVMRAYQRIRNDGIPAALVFVGSGEHESVLKSYVKANGVPDVHFFGFRNQSELPKFYALADIFVFPPENESWGLIVNEVMCAGVPIIASEEIGAVPDLLRNGENGFTFPAGDVDLLEHHIRTLLTDQELRKRMGKKSRAIIENWDNERCVKAIQSALNLVKKVDATTSRGATAELPATHSKK